MASAADAAWLDSLSEDWTSEPRDPSISPASNKSSGSIQVHEVFIGDGDSPRQVVPDQLPSTMYVDYTHFTTYST